MKPIAFTTNPGRMGYRELFRVAGSPGVGLFACALKLFRLLGPQGDGFGMRSFGDRLDRRDVDSLPRHVLKEMRDYRSDLEDLGFIPAFAYSLEAFGSQEAHGMPHRHKTGVAAASISYARCVRDDKETLTTVFGLNTPLADDTFLMTSGSKRLLTKPRHFLAENMPGATPREVFERHIERLEKARALPRTVKTDDELAQLVLDCENEETEFNIERGVYVRMSRSEVELGEEMQEEFRERDESGGVHRQRREEEDEEDDESDYGDDEDDRDEADDDYDDKDDDEDDQRRPRRRRGRR